MARPPRQHLFLCLLIIITTSTVAGAQAVIVYLDGRCELLENGRWFALRPGDAVEPGDTIRVSQDGYIEIGTASGTIRLTGEGEYRMSELLGRAEQARSTGAQRVFSSRLERILGTADPLPQSTASGVRGDESDRNRMPVTGRDAERIRGAASLLASGSLQAAHHELETGLNEIDDVRLKPHYVYLLGVAEYGLGDPTGALSRLQDPGPDPDSSFYYDHAMLLAQLQIELFQYEQTIGVLEDLSAWYAGLDRDSDAQLLLGMAYLGAGRSGLAEEHLTRVTEDPARAVARGLLADIGEQASDE